jgi:hypothetical protein
MTEMSAKAAVCIRNLQTAAYRGCGSHSRPSAFGQPRPLVGAQYYGAMERHLAPIFRALADMPRRALTDLRVQVIESSGSAELG